MAEETNDEQVLDRLFEQISEHLETRWAYFSLTATERLSGIAADIAGAVTVFVLALFVLLFFSMGLAWWLGNFIGSRAGGFALTGLIFVPIAAMYYHWIRAFVRRKVIQYTLPEDEATNPTSHE